MSSFIKSSPQSGYFQPGMSGYGVQTPPSDSSSPMQQHPPPTLLKGFDNYPNPPPEYSFVPQPAEAPQGSVPSPAKLSALKALHTQQLAHQSQSAAGPSTLPPTPPGRGASTRKPPEPKLDDNTRSLLRHLARLVPDEADEMRILALGLAGPEIERSNRGKKVGHH
jgi:hypothetical protein